MKKLLLTCLGLSMLVLPLTANAGANSTPGTGPNPYSDCGIGAALFAPYDLPVGAVISNAIWDLGSTAITSAISSPETCNARQTKTAALILETMPELEKDIAMGEGEYVVALTETMGCGSSNDVTASLRSGYANVVADEAYASHTTLERASAMYAVASDAAAANSCTL